MQAREDAQFLATDPGRCVTDLDTVKTNTGHHDNITALSNSCRRPVSRSSWSTLCRRSPVLRSLAMSSRPHGWMQATVCAGKLTSCMTA